MSSQERKVANTHSEMSSSVADDAMNSKARDRAIACLPELIEAARDILFAIEVVKEQLDSKGIVFDAHEARLRRILARIEGSDNESGS